MPSKPIRRRDPNTPAPVPVSLPTVKRDTSKFPRPLPRVEEPEFQPPRPAARKTQILAEVADVYDPEEWVEANRDVRMPSARSSRRRSSSPKEVSATKIDLMSYEQRLEFLQKSEMERQRGHALEHNRRSRAIERDIGELPIEDINWARRLACKMDLRLFLETYLKPMFYMGWSTDQLKCVSKAMRVILEKQQFCLAMPRGGGKTAICRGAQIWANAYGHSLFSLLVGSSNPKAKQSLTAVKTLWYQNHMLRQDFPEIAFVLELAEGRWSLARNLTYRDLPTHCEWGAERIKFPALILPKDIAERYAEYDPESVRSLNDPSWDGSGDMPEGDFYARNAWGIVTCTGIEAGIRGDAETHPLTLRQIRPDFVVLDDVQRDVKANSDTSVERMIEIIEGAVAGIPEPGQILPILMPCTVIREGDVADTFLDPTQKPEFQGERCRMVIHWPPGITDHQITLDTEAGRLWNEYNQLRISSYNRFGDFRQATEFYKLHRQVMDEGFICSWEERFDRKQEISAQQNAMNLRLKAPESFLAEFQNIGRKDDNEGELMITAEQLARKINHLPRGHAAVESQIVVAHIDVQEEIFYWSIFACDYDFNGSFVDYGTWPPAPGRWFRKEETKGWGLMSSSFFKENPQHKSKAIQNSSGRVQAPFEARIYHGLMQTVSHILSKEIQREGDPPLRMNITRLGIDSRWGQANDVIRRFIRESKVRELIPTYGQAFPPTNKQIEEYELRKGWLFEHQRHRNIKEPKWLIRPRPDGMRYMAMDVNRLKDFLFQRLSTPMGASGNVSLFQAPAEEHELFASHICNSEYPEPMLAIGRGILKNQWKEREHGGFDNDYLDTAVGCMALASYEGASIKTTEEPPKPQRRRLSEIYKDKHGRD